MRRYLGGINVALVNALRRILIAEGLIFVGFIVDSSYLWRSFRNMFPVPTMAIGKVIFASNTSVRPCAALNVVWCSVVTTTLPTHHLHLHHAPQHMRVADLLPPLQQNV